jgi:hypothetical protein
MMRLVWLLSLILLVVGCTSRNLRTMQQLYAQDHLGAAVASARVYANEQKNGRDALIAHLELGHVLFTDGQTDEALAAFDIAEGVIEQIDLQPETSISEEILVAYSHPEQAKYRPIATDRVMLAVYRALIYMHQQRPDLARPSLVAASFRVDDAQEQYAKLSKAAQNALAQTSRSNGVNLEQTLSHNGTRSALDKRYAPLQQYIDRDGYKHPLADWLRAVFLLSTSNDPADADVAVTLLQRVQRIVSDHSGVAEDLAAAKQATRQTNAPPLSGGGRGVAVLRNGVGEPTGTSLQTNPSAPTALGNTTYVIFATGLAPYRSEFRIDLPLFLVNNEVDYFGIAFPTLEYRGDFVSSLSVRSSKGDVAATLLADMDRVITTDFELQKPQMIARAIGIAVTKAATAWAIGEALEDSDPLLQFSVRLAAGLYQYATNTADRRSWNTLPKRFLVARTPTPSDGVISLEPSTGPETSITVPTRGVNIIYARSIRAGVPMTVMTLHLAPGTAPGTAPGILETEPSP